MGKIENEPALPECLGSKSLVFAPTAGMRLAPEVLVFELFRELGYGDSRKANEIRAREFSDIVDTPSLPKAEHLLLATCRGRQKKTRGKRREFFYAPPYLGLSRHAWLRRRTDRTMRDYFLGGPLAHREALGGFDKDLVVRALLGHRSAPVVEESRGKEILSLLALEERADPLRALSLATLRKQFLSFVARRWHSVDTRTPWHPFLARTFSNSADWNRKSHAVNGSISLSRSLGLQRRCGCSRTCASRKWCGTGCSRPL